MTEAEVCVAKSNALEIHSPLAEIATQDIRANSYGVRGSCFSNDGRLYCGELNIEPDAEEHFIYSPSPFVVLIRYERPELLQSPRRIS